MPRNLEFNAVIFPLSDGSSFTIVHNLPLHGPGNFDATLEDWLMCTHQLTAESFCMYVFEQKRNCFAGNIVMTKDQFETKFKVKFEDYFRY